MNRPEHPALAPERAAAVGNRATHALPPTRLRVARHTAAPVNQRLRARSDAEVARLEAAPAADLDRHLDRLGREWDVERVLQTNASTLVLLGLALGSTLERRLLWLPVGVLAFFAQHALQGWCPPLPVLRRLGVRTVAEIERERHAVKLLRGDFDQLPSAGAPADRVRAVLEAVDR